jgi:(p)ppGpp synthase/HD superfamily hydrolase
MIVGMNKLNTKNTIEVSQYEGSATLERAIAIAAAAHEKVSDKGGSPYILHPLRVMMKQTTEAARMVAVLHDVVEDAGVSLDDLRHKAHFPKKVIHALSLVTKKPKLANGEEESYEDFIDRCATDSVARAVKLADLEDNMNALRLKEFDDGAAVRFRKYLAAHRRLSGKGKESD